MTLLDVDALREHVTTSVGDEALERLLDDAEAAIVAFAGPVDSAVEVVSGGYGHLTASRPVETITSVVERDGWSTPTTLAADDYEVLSRFVIGRKRYGTNRASTFRGPVRLTYVPVDDTATREAVQVELVRLALATQPGLASETVGAWTQTYASGSKSVPELRGDILARLRETAGMVIVGG